MAQDQASSAHRKPRQRHPSHLSISSCRPFSAYSVPVATRLRVENPHIPSQPTRPANITFHHEASLPVIDFFPTHPSGLQHVSTQLPLQHSHPPTSSDQRNLTSRQINPTAPATTARITITQHLLAHPHPRPSLLRLKLQLPGHTPEPHQPSVRMALPIPNHHRPVAGDTDLHAGPAGRHHAVAHSVHNQEPALHVLGADGSADLGAVLGPAGRRPGAGGSTRPRAPAARGPGLSPRPPRSSWSWISSCSRRPGRSPPSPLWGSVRPLPWPIGSGSRPVFRGMASIPIPCLSCWRIIRESRFLRPVRSSWRF